MLKRNDELNVQAAHPWSAIDTINVDIVAINDMMTSSIRNGFRVTGPLWEESTGLM